jgi:hypothetical protein
MLHDTNSHVKSRASPLARFLHLQDAKKAKEQPNREAGRGASRVPYGSISPESRATANGAPSMSSGGTARLTFFTSSLMAYLISGLGPATSATQTRTCSPMTPRA